MVSLNAQWLRRTAMELRACDDEAWIHRFPVTTAMQLEQAAAEIELLLKEVDRLKSLLLARP